MWWGAPRKACEILGRETNRCEAPVPGLIVPGAEGQAIGSAGQVPGPRGQAPATGATQRGRTKGPQAIVCAKLCPTYLRSLRPKKGKGLAQLAQS